MKNFLDKIFFRSNNLDFVSQAIKDLTKNTPSNKIFEAINSYSSESEVRYVGGCIRKILNKENVDDIDLASNLKPNEICKALKEKKINYFETGIKHGTITAVLGKFKFEITSLRKDILTDGRHAKVKFSQNWKQDSLRRDFTINSIYSDKDGNLFDPHNGINDLEKGLINFIGDPDKRIKEDYLRILRYLRFFLNYSKQPHNREILKKLKMNIDGISRLSKERLLDELKKIIKVNTLEKLSKDKLSLDLILMIFPELKNIEVFSNLNINSKNILKEKNFIFLLSLLIIDNSDNTNYFLYKFNLSKKDQKRIRIIYNFYKDKITNKSFDKKKLNKIFYYDGKQAVEDILCFKIINSKNTDKKLFGLFELYQNMSLPIMPIGANILMTKYQIPEGKQLGSKLKMIEEQWVQNDFRISEQQVKNIINN